MVPSSALPLTIRAIIGDRERNDMSASVIEGIVVGIRMLFLPLIMSHCPDILRSGSHHNPPPLVCLQNVYSYQASSDTSFCPLSSPLHEPRA